MTHPALHTSEILYDIFDYADPKSLAQNAIVCKAWLDPALDTLWKEIDGLEVLLNTLTRMIQKRRVWGLDFYRRIQPSDWDRFQLYARRIQSLRHIDEANAVISASCFSELASRRRSLIIMPALKHLEWDTASLDPLSLFLHPGLEDLSIVLPYMDVDDDESDELEAAQTFFAEAALRVDMLTTLHIKAGFSIRVIQELLVTYLSKSLGLKTLVLPRFWISAPVIAATAHLPHLEVLRWTCEVHPGGKIEDIRNIQPPSQTHSFPALRDLRLECCLIEATTFIASHNFSARNETLQILPTAPVSPHDIQSFFSACSCRCQRLTNLHLIFIDIPQGGSIGLETLKPMFGCPTIQSFVLRCNTPVTITNLGLVELAKSWPSLIELELAIHPYHTTIPVLDIKALLPLAQHCRHLKHLKLYINTQAPLSLDDFKYPSFASLQTLNFGISPITVENTENMALFLNHMISRNGSSIYVREMLEYLEREPISSIWNNNETQELLPAEVIDEAKKRVAVWETVRSSLVLLLRARLLGSREPRRSDLELYVGKLTCNY